MALIGYHASHEQFAPEDLLRYARAAQLAGFDALSCSDHFHPWSERQGHSGNAWAWLGAVMATVDLPAGTVNCPFGRYHPAVVAQAAATLAAMFPERFWFAVGSGEALNEHIDGRPWPGKPQREAMLRESVDVMRALWRGEEVTHRGAITVDRARLYSLPARPPRLFAAALSEQTARWAGEWADGLITVTGPREQMRKVIDAFRDASGGNKPVYLQAKIAWADPSQGDDAARAMAFEQWRTNVFDSQTLADLAMPADFDARAGSVKASDIEESVRISCDAAQQAAWLAEDLAMGAEAIFLHNVCTNQQAWIETCAQQVLPALKDA
ncbi:TIGR03885 family FMN-dependent LLM class oxidoreductase [Cupriavidus sp. AU9028]|uniref:TIGR03885 family FMN-dependent LLM class oxidoreductase n=1 Tax=Cupriavidus sp. AU9028 TaxID=2871157 RepID=UPI001C9583EE|nr:TIGR03885 family FMN-dependent LLM class oxidoreductase [Cupriavidus sp. AU9028]MBY4895526.1 TIGR03885 family FMN-dependent LLM class oxidoreductase [Cupriavidus sp. AU9028]